MADKKLTKAQQAAEPKKNKKLTVEEAPKKESKALKAAEPKKPELKKAVPIRANAAFPLRYAFAAVCAVMLLVFVSVFFTDDGIIPQWIVSVVSGLFGKNVYYISMPALLYLIWLQLSSRDQLVRGRTFSICGFVMIFGCMSHLVANPDYQQTGWAHLLELYETGQLGKSGGVICGFLTDSLAAGFGRFFIGAAMLVLSVICLMVGAKLDLVGMFTGAWEFLCSGISNLRAARAEKELDELDEEDYEDDDQPSLLERTVDHFASRRAERKALKASEEEVEPARSLRERTAAMIHDIAPELDDQFEHPDYQAPTPVSVRGDEPELLTDLAPQAEIAANKKVTAKDATQQAVQISQEIAASQAAPKPEYQFPPLELLQKPRGRAADGTAEMKENTRRLNETLASFRIEAHISNVTRGPSVTRYEVELEKGVRLNKLTSCADDIALSLGASGVRIAPVPGKISVVGIEVPNQSVTTVSLRDVIGSDEFAAAKSHSSIAVGKDIGGTCIIGNIAKFPHMLIAGTTGSGKSVCMNSIIISLLYKASPEDVKLIMVDPKMVELGIYNGIPHLLIPVVTDPKKAAGSLQWAVTEMMRRYRSMSDAGVRDLESYNSMIEGEEIEGEKLPQVVVIIDELADLMLVAAKEVEESICRIAQMGRAAGIHLIIATQRPSADVITGLMKANIPSRIAFAVASAMESRIILDTQGAEKLVGKGDMLYSPIGSGKPQRVQGCFVTDAEVEAVATYVKEHFSSTYDQAVMDDIARKAEQTGSKNSTPATAFDPDPSADELAGDEMLPDAVEVILETKQASVSLLQRRLKLGYARAARIVDEMEEKGIVGPFVGSKPRQILITKEQWEQMKQGQTIVTQPDPVPDDIDIPF